MNRPQKISVVNAMRCYAGPTLLLIVVVVVGQESPPMCAARDIEHLPPIDSDLVTLKQTILPHYDSINSMEVAYRASGQGTKLESRHIVKQIANTRRVENIHFGLLPPELDTNHTIQLFDGTTLDVFNVNARYFETSLRNATLPYVWKVRVDFYVTLIGWWPPQESAPPDEISRNLFRPIRFLVSDPKATISHSSESGVENCVVITRPMRDRTWLDADLNYSVRRREVLDPKTGKVTVRALLADFQNCSVGGSDPHWLPRRAEIVFPEHDGVAESKNTVISVESIALNRVAAADCAFKLPPGTIIEDRDSGERSLLPDGLDTLDQNIKMAKDFRQYARRSRDIAEVK